MRGKCRTQRTCVVNRAKDSTHLKINVVHHDLVEINVVHHELLDY